MNWSKYRAHLIMLLDVIITFVCNFLLFLPAVLREDIQLLNLILHIGLLTVCVLLFQIILKTYNSLWRYAESREYMVLLLGMSLGFGLYTVVNLIIDTNVIWITEAFTGTAISLLCMLAFRFSYRMLRVRTTGRRINEKGLGNRHVAIIGTGLAGVSLLRELTMNSGGVYVPYCMIDDAVDKIGKKVMGMTVYGPIENLEEILQNTPVTDIVLAITNLDNSRRAEILKLCSKTSCRLHIINDPLMQLEQKEAGFANNVREVEIEDLLNRQPVNLDNRALLGFIRGKTVMVTGGGGSIGSELCRQIMRYEPRELIVVDIAENSTYQMQQELLHLYGDEIPLTIEIASVRDENKINDIFKKYRPNYVFHAAAHKHVPLMENCPDEAIKNNVFGTYFVAMAAKKFGAEKFVLISTDKAVNPTNVMGATKYLCEKVIQAVGENSETEFAAVRFGNVLGSAGSVIPLFKKQIEYGGPVTITDKRIIRYFMTIPEAVQLVLEAGSFAQGGEVFVLDMGEPVHIIDLAENLIRLSGYIPNVDIEIKEVGLRPGEKLFEELLTDSAMLKKTENKKIFIEEKPAVNFEQLCEDLRGLRKAMETSDNDVLLEEMHKIVPTFKTPEEVNKSVVSA